MAQIFLKMTHTELSRTLRIDGPDTLNKSWKAIGDNAWRCIAQDVLNVPYKACPTGSILTVDQPSIKDNLAVTVNA